MGGPANIFVGRLIQNLHATKPKITWWPPCKALVFSKGCKTVQLDKVVLGMRRGCKTIQLDKSVLELWRVFEKTHQTWSGKTIQLDKPDILNPSNLEVGYCHPDCDGFSRKPITIPSKFEGTHHNPRVVSKVRVWRVSVLSIGLWRVFRKTHHNSGPDTTLQSVTGFGPLIPPKPLI